MITRCIDLSLLVVLAGGIRLPMTSSVKISLKSAVVEKIEGPRNNRVPRIGPGAKGSPDYEWGEISSFIHPFFLNGGARLLRAYWEGRSRWLSTMARP